MHFHPRLLGFFNPPFHSPSAAWIDAYQKRGYAVTSADPSARVLDHIALITWPPDARYSPLAPGNAWRPAANAVPAPAVQLGGQAGGSKPGHVASATAARGSDRAGGAAPTGRGLRGAVSSSSNASSSGQAFAQQTASAMAAKEGLVRALVFPVEDSLVAIAPKEWEVGPQAAALLGAVLAACTHARRVLDEAWAGCSGEGQAEGRRLGDAGLALVSYARLLRAKGRGCVRFSAGPRRT